MRPCNQICQATTMRRTRGIIKSLEESVARGLSSRELAAPLSIIAYIYIFPPFNEITVYCFVIHCEYTSITVKTHAPAHQHTCTYRTTGELKCYGGTRTELR